MMTRTSLLILVTALSFSFSDKGFHSRQLSGDPVTRSYKDTNSFRPGSLWYDESGEIINAHGGGILLVNKTYYWFGEKRGKQDSECVSVYSSKDLYHWKQEDIALSKSDDPQSDITVGCVMERPKVIYN